MAKSDASSKVLELLQKENKPFSTNEVFETLGKEFAKAAIQKALDSLLFREKIAEKSIGKQKIYYCRQADCDPKEIKAELQMLSQKKSSLELALKTKQEKIRELETKLKSFAAIPSLEALELERNQLLGMIEGNTKKLGTVQAKQGKKVSSDEVKRVDKKHTNFLSVYRKRKRICTDMMEAILEGYPKSKKHLIEDIGLETDEAVGFLPPK